MKVKELREVLANADDDAIIVVSDVNWAHINLTTASMVGNIVYLDCVEEFPEDWYDEEGLERNYDYANDKS